MRGRGDFGAVERDKRRGEEDVVLEDAFWRLIVVRTVTRMDDGLGNPLLGLEKFSSEDVDLESLPLEEVFEQLSTSRDGLSSADAAERLQLFGPNRLEEKRENKIMKFLSFMWNPLSWVMEAAAVMALILANGGSEGPDWEDFLGIVCLLIINSTISFIEENNADSAAAALMARLALKTKVLEVNRFSLCASVMQSALTGESLPVTKRTGDLVFSGSTCKHGEIEAVVIATGIQSFFGKAAHLVDSTEVVGHFQKASTQLIQKYYSDAGVTEYALFFSDLLMLFMFQILNLCYNKDDIAERVQTVIDEFAERGLRSLAVAYQEIPERSRHSPGGPWILCGLLPLFDPPRHDSADTIRRALNLGVCVKMITGDHLAIAKETGRRLGMGTNMHPSASLFGRHNGEDAAALPVDELVEKADGFAGVFPEHKYEIVRILQEKGHICGMTGDGVNDAPALKKADIGIAVSDATDAARGAADIVLTEPGLSVIVSAVLTSRAIFQRMKNYTIYAVSITIRIVVGFALLALIWEYDFPPFMVLIIAILNDGTIMTISKDRVKPSRRPDQWKLKEIFVTGVVMGTYLALVTVLFYWAVTRTTFFETHFKVKSLQKDVEKISSAMYLQVSIISQALIFVTRSRGFSFLDRPGSLLICAFIVAQLVATLIAVYATVSFAFISAIGWRWAGVIWLYSLVFYVPLDFIKITVQYILSGKAWNLLFDRKTAFTRKRDFGKEDREVKWALSQRDVQRRAFSDHLLSSTMPSSRIADQAKRRAEITRLGERHALKAHVESVMRLKRVNSHTIRTAQTV
ncbi:hypothetical protein EJB05_07791, partial [Eragrostis curvula]